MHNYKVTEKPLLIVIKRTTQLITYARGRRDLWEDESTVYICRDSCGAIKPDAKWFVRHRCWRGVSALSPFSVSNVSQLARMLNNWTLPASPHQLFYSSVSKTPSTTPPSQNRPCSTHVSRPSSCAQLSNPRSLSSLVDWLVRRFSLFTAIRLASLLDQRELETAGK